MDYKELKEVRDGKVIVLDNDDKEVEIDLKGTLSKISELNAESAGRRIRLKELEEKLLDYEKAKEEQTLETEKETSEIVKGYKTKVEGLEGKLNSKDELIRKLTIGNKFASSEFINKNTILTPEIAESYFSKAFSVDEHGNVVAKRQDGSPILDKDNPERFASFEDALKVLVNDMPSKDKILAPPASGDGMKTGNVQSGFSSISKKADFKTLKEKTEWIKEHGLDAFKKLK